MGNIVIQSNINAFGAYAISGQGAYAKIEGFVFLRPPQKAGLGQHLQTRIKSDNTAGADCPKDNKMVQKAIHANFLFGLLSSLLATAVGSP